MGNVPPAEAIDRLGRFREGFNIRQRKQELFSGGEILFKLPVTEYPEIGVTGKELNLTENVRTFFFKSHFFVRCIHHRFRSSCVRQFQDLTVFLPVHSLSGLL